MVKFYYYFSKQLVFLFPPYCFFILWDILFSNSESWFGNLHFSNEKFNRAKYLEANSFSLSLNLWFAVSRIRSHEQVAASSIHSPGLRRPWPAVPFWSKASVPQPEIEVSSQKWEHQILAVRPVVNDKALALRLCRKRIPTKTKSSETKYLSRGRKKKESTVCADRHTGELRERVAESSPHGSWNYCYAAFLLGFLWAIILICLVQSPYLVYPRIFPRMHTHLLTKMDAILILEYWSTGLPWVGGPSGVRK